MTTAQSHLTEALAASQASPEWKLPGDSRARAESRFLTPSPGAHAAHTWHKEPGQPRVWHGSFFPNNYKSPRASPSRLGEETGTLPSVPVPPAAVTAAGAVRPRVPTDTRQHVGQPPRAHCGGEQLMRSCSSGQRKWTDSNACISPAIALSHLEAQRCDCPLPPAVSGCHTFILPSISSSSHWAENLLKP